MIAGILEATSGREPGDSSGIGALEVAAGLWARAFAAATVSPMNPATAGITPSILAMIGRQLVRHGENLFALKMVDGELKLVPAGSWDVRGGWDERDWMYRVDLFGASEHTTELIPSAGVAHLRYSVDPGTPWIGQSPLSWARHTGALTANLETRLAEEAGAPVANLLPIPDAHDGGDGDEDTDPLAALKLDIRNARGRTLLLETTASGWGQGQGAAPQRDLKQSRVGFDAPASALNLHGASALAVLGACGVPVSLAVDADGTGARESWRALRHGIGGTCLQDGLRGAEPEVGAGCPLRPQQPLGP